MRLILKLATWAVVLVVLALAGVLGIRIWDIQRSPPLALWHKFAPDELKVVWKLRRVLAALDSQQAIELLLTKLRQTSSNYEFLMQVQKTTPSVSGAGEDV